MPATSKELRLLVDELMADYDLMPSTSIQETLDELAKMVGVPTNDEMNELIKGKKNAS